MAIQKHSIPDSSAAIYGESANINYFINTPLTPDTAGGVTNSEQTVKAHTRRRYVGDSTPSNVTQHPRTVMYDPGRRNGTATPGQEMILTDGIEKRSFTYTGPWIEVHAFLVGQAKTEITAYSASAAYVIAAAAEA